LALPDRAAAHAHALAALAAAERLGDARLLERAEWLSLVTEPARAASGTPLAIPWVGRATAAAAVPAAAGLSPAVRHELQRGQLTAWRGLLAAGSPAGRRAARYLAFEHGGDAPDALTAYLYGASRLLSAPRQAEIWLDALAAVDAPRYTARAYAFSRWRAARWRGDAPAAARWRKRLVALLPLAAAPRAAELWQQAGL